MQLERPAVDADAVGEAGAAEHVVGAQHVLADQPARLADAELRRDLERIGVFEAGHARPQEAQVVDGLAAALDLAVAQRDGIGAVDGRAVGVLQLGDVDAPLAGVLLRPHDGAAAREAEVAGGLGFVHPRRDRAPGVACSRCIDVADAEHQRRVEHGAGLAAIHRQSGEVGEVAVARAVDEDAAADGAPAGLGLDQQRFDRAAVAAGDADGEGVEEQLGAGREQQLIGGAFERRGVVGLGADPAEDQVRFVEAAECCHACEQVVGDAVDDTSNRAVHVGVQAAEVGHAGRRAHAAEKAVAFDEQRAGAVPRR